MLLSGGCIQERSDDNNSGSYEDRNNSPEGYDGDESCNGDFSLRWNGWTMDRISLNGEWNGWDGDNWRNYANSYDDDDVEYEKGGVDEGDFFRFSVEYENDGDEWWSPANDGSGWDTTGSLSLSYDCGRVTYDVVPTTLDGYEYLANF